MARKMINMSLNGRSISRAIKELQQYKNSLDFRCALFVEELGKIGVKTAQEIFHTDGEGDSPRTVSVTFELTDTRNNKCVGQIVATGEGVLFWEFGAGIYYNNGNAHPKAAELGMGVGTYPNQRHAINPGYWWYTDDAGKAHFSRGTEATMPMYKASLEMIDKIKDVAKEVFR